MNTHYSTSPETNDAPSNISIVGAGITGLMTAHNLRAAGYTGIISVYDAAASSGGRLESKRVANDAPLMEFGAGRMHKTRHSQLHMLCQTLNLELVPFNYAMQYRSVEDKQANEQRAEFAKVFSILEAAAPAYARQNISFANFCAEVVGEKTLKQLQLRSGYDTLLNPSLPVQSGLTILAHHPETQSLLYGNTDNWLSIKGGFQKLTHALERELQDHVRFHYQAELKNIGSTEQGHHLTFENPKGFFKTTSDMVILAMPLQNIQAVQGWTDIASDDLSQDIEGIPLVKGYAWFDRPWWEDHGFADTCVISDTPIRKLYLAKGNNLAWFYCDSTSALKTQSLLESRSHSPLQLLEQHIGQKMPENATLLGSGWKFWERGITFLKNPPAADISKGFLEVAQNLLICSDVLTKNLGWIEGCLTSASAVADHVMSLPERPNLDAATPSLSKLSYRGS